MLVEVVPIYLWCKKRATVTIGVYTVDDFWNVIIFVFVGGEKYIFSVSFYFVIAGQVHRNGITDDLITFVNW